MFAFVSPVERCAANWMNGYYTFEHGFRERGACALRPAIHVQPATRETRLIIIPGRLVDV